MAKTALPGHYKRRFTVSSGYVSRGTPETDDGRPIDTVGDLLDAVTYVGDLERLDGRWALVLQWVDKGGDGHRFLIPHEVIERIITHTERIRAEARSDRAQNAAQTRREKGEATQ